MRENATEIYSIHKFLRLRREKKMRVSKSWVLAVAGILCFAWSSAQADPGDPGFFVRIIEIDGFPFMLSGLLLATSVILDMKQRHVPFEYATVQLVEECCKFVGAVLWLYFCGRAGSAPMSAVGQAGADA